MTQSSASNGTHPNGATMTYATQDQQQQHRHQQTTQSATATTRAANLPLSMTFMRSLSGVGNSAAANAPMCCTNCGNRFDVLHDWDPSIDTVVDDAGDTVSAPVADTTTPPPMMTLMCFETNVAANPPPPSAVSPLVWAPMMMTNPSSSSSSSWQYPTSPLYSIMSTPTHTQRLLMDYMTICKFYGCPENVGVLTTLRYSLPACRVSPGFGDVDMLALAELWLLHTTTNNSSSQQHQQQQQIRNGTNDDNGPLQTNGFHPNSNNSNHRSNNNQGSHRNSNFSLLQHVTRLDLSLASSKVGAVVAAGSSSTNSISVSGKARRSTGISSHGALALAKVLQQPNCALQQVLLPRNRIGPYGATALFCAAATNSTLHTLGMRQCRVGQRGALAFCQLILATTPPIINNNSDSQDQQQQQQQSEQATQHYYSRRCGLRNVDLSANFIGFHGCHAIEQALYQRQVQRQKAKEAASTEPPLSFITVNLEGNLVFQEIMNGVTHGLGVVLGVLACIFLSIRVRNKSWTHISSCAIYSTSLLVLYISSTLYHSFFCLQQTRYLFEIFDKSAIYILIAGSYTPFLQIVLRHNPLWSNYLLGFLWMCCFAGIGVEAMWPTWRMKVWFSLMMYLGMGWSAVVVLPEVMDLAPSAALRMLVLGGVAYTSGVPFFVRNHNLDHSIWHLFVLAGSILHWVGIYEYVATYPYDEVVAVVANATCSST